MEEEEEEEADIGKGVVVVWEGKVGKRSEGTGDHDGGRSRS